MCGDRDQVENKSLCKGYKNVIITNLRAGIVYGVSLIKKEFLRKELYTIIYIGYN